MSLNTPYGDSPYNPAQYNYPHVYTVEPRESEARVRKLDLESEVLGFQLKKFEKEWANIAANQPLNNIYLFYGPVTDGKVKDTIETLDMWSRRGPGSDISIIFHSEGGSVFSGYALFDFILDLRHRGHKVTTKALGMAASMAAVLLQAGDERVMTRNSYLMLHEVASGAGGSTSDVEDTVKLMKRLEKRGNDIFCERSNLTLPKIKSLTNRKDAWLDANEALSLGLVDRIQD
jgi:ATP-dependent Clp endopeptidase proteolytic subunit ClpP